MTRDEEIRLVALTTLGVELSRRGETLEFNPAWSTVERRAAIDGYYSAQILKLYREKPVKRGFLKRLKEWLR